MIGDVSMCEPLMVGLRRCTEAVGNDFVLGNRQAFVGQLLETIAKLLIGVKQRPGDGETCSDLGRDPSFGLSGM